MHASQRSLPPAAPACRATISAAALPLISDVLAGAGLDAPRAFAETGLSVTLAPTNAIPLDRFTTLLENAGRQADTQACLWSCGRRIAEPALATLFPSGLGETRLGGLLSRLMADLQALQEGTTFDRQVEGDTCTLAYRIHDPRIWPRSRDAEFTLGFLHAVIERFAGTVPMAELALEHEQDGCRAALARQAGCAPLYGQRLNMLAFPARLLDLAIAADAFPAPGHPPDHLQRNHFDGDARQRIGEAIRRRVGQGPFSQGDIAADLGLSGRSLRRLLDADGPSFRSMTDDARLDYALWALQRTKLPVGEIAWRLGYTDQGAFARAFRKVTGAPPSGLRKDAGSSG
ncbi:AraC-like transcriptional regulator QhpR [Stappia indica]|uniref:AraC-like transcriptional regulator QhpR n=1 Tax=Stappia indica TaxID=538381 RepID=UPI0008368486|nr:AraC family transcriptional regulator [Stappia indica]